MALLGCGFDPGQSQIYVAHAAKHHFDEIHYLDIVDCNAGDHGQAFATNFNPEINIREITQDGKYWENGEWKIIKPMSIHKPMTFGQAYLTHLEVMQNIGITSIKPIMFQGREIIPIEFLKALLPEPGSLGENYSGETSIGCQIKGIKDGKDQTYFIWNNCKHQDAYNDSKAQGVSYTTGVPAMLGAKLMLEGIWMKPGVYNTEEMDPDPFMAQIGGYGLPWHEKVGLELPHEY